MQNEFSMVAFFDAFKQEHSQLFVVKESFGNIVSSLTITRHHTKTSPNAAIDAQAFNNSETGWCKAFFSFSNAHLEKLSINNAR